MGIRIQQKEITIPDDPKEDLFKNDLLNRKESVDILTHTVGSIEGPCTLAVDAPWGSGKTTFINLWSQYLRNHGFAVVKFSAWENDFFDDPFVALCAELSTDKNTGIDTEQLMEAGKKLMKHIGGNAASQIIAAMTAGTVNMSELVKAGETDIEKRLEQYQDAKSAIKDFRDSLQNMATAAAAEKQHGPLVVMIDELDRCRPSYAVELLEIAKHIFSVNNIVYVLAINRSELEHSVRAIYGTGFDAKGYLRRFFDVDFHLPYPDQKAFVNGLLDSTQINDYLKRTNYSRATSEKEMLGKFFSTTNLSLREIGQAIHRLGLIFASLPERKISFFTSAVVVLILRTIDVDLYREFVHGEVSDLDVIESLFKSPKMKFLQQTQEGQLFEAVIIMADKEIARATDHPPEIFQYVTPLQQQYKWMNKKPK